MNMKKLLSVMLVACALNAINAQAKEDCKVHLIGTINKSPAMMPVSWEIKDTSGELIKLITNRQSQVIELPCNVSYMVSAKCNSINRTQPLKTVSQSLQIVAIEFGANQ
jgi:hypothetical protein